MTRLELTQRRLAFIVAAASALASAFGLVASTPAQAAAGSVTVSAPNMVLYPGCYQRPIQYNIESPPGMMSWEMSISVLGPDGVPAASTYFYSTPETWGTLSGSKSILICGGFDPGRYTITGFMNYESVGNYYGRINITPASFDLRLPKTRTRLRTSRPNPAIGQRFVLSSASTDERPNGYFPTNTAKVVLQRQVGTTWKRVSGTYTDRWGKARFALRWTSRSPVRYRVVTRGNQSYSRSVSPVIRVR